MCTLDFPRRLCQLYVHIYVCVLRVRTCQSLGYYFTYRHEKCTFHNGLELDHQPPTREPLLPDMTSSYRRLLGALGENPDRETSATRHKDSETSATRHKDRETSATRPKDTHGDRETSATRHKDRETPALAKPVTTTTTTTS
uniref:GTP cyclohydrolase 1 n=1 Tax=Cacopsylla melanoneura TaxID=428564 RepID=A0A8D8XW14_9HEMI